MGMRRGDARHYARFIAGCQPQSAINVDWLEPDKSRLLDAFAALSHDASFAMGCYCEDEARCHRSVLRQLLTQRGAAIAP